MLTRAAVASVVSLVAALLLGSPARAEGDCTPGSTPTSVPGAGVICIRAHDPGSSSDPVPEPSPPERGDQGCQREDGAPVDCVRPYGVWVSAHQCYASPVELPPGHPAWKGHTDGAVWMCTLIDDTAPEVLFWVPPGGPGGGPPPDAAELAQSAVGTLGLAQADLHLAPTYPDPAVVGIETWLWLPESQWQALTKTVRAGGTAVTVTATPDRVVWDMGPGETTCFDAGRAWVDGMGDDAVTRCGYTYDETSTDEPEGVFGVTATISYAVDWSCSGVCTATSGSLGLVAAPAGTGTVRVVQRQTVVVR